MRGPTDTYDVMAEIQRLTAENDKLKERIAELEAEVADLRAEIDTYSKIDEAS